MIIIFLLIIFYMNVIYINIYYCNAIILIISIFFIFTLDLGIHFDTVLVQIVVCEKTFILKIVSPPNSVFLVEELSVIY